MDGIDRCCSVLNGVSYMNSELSILQNVNPDGRFSVWQYIGIQKVYY